jgi:hypothetical protein
MSMDCQRILVSTGDFSWRGVNGRQADDSSAARGAGDCLREVHDRVPSCYVLIFGTLSKRDNAVCCYLAIYPDPVAAAT